MKMRFKVFNIRSDYEPLGFKGSAFKFMLMSDFSAEN